MMLNQHHCIHRHWTVSCLMACWFFLASHIQICFRSAVVRQGKAINLAVTQSCAIHCFRKVYSMRNYLFAMSKGQADDKGPNRRLIVAHDLIERLSEKLGLSLTALGSLTGAQLAGCQYRHPLFDRTSPVVIGGDYITTDSGTGLVHTAPGHGQEDYQAKTSDSHFNPCICIACIISNRT